MPCSSPGGRSWRVAAARTRCTGCAARDRSQSSAARWTAARRARRPTPALPSSHPCHPQTQYNDADLRHAMQSMTPLALLCDRPRPGIITAPRPCLCSGHARSTQDATNSSNIWSSHSTSEPCACRAKPQARQGINRQQINWQQACQNTCGDVTMDMGRQAPRCDADSVTGLSCDSAYKM